MSSEVLYRKWRPRRFGDVAGQDPVTRTLRNAVAAGKVSHAYLFAGPRGTGKTSTGRILAKAVNCLDPQDGEPCDVCSSCQDFNDGRAMDLIELDAASNRGIDEMRSLRDKVGFSPNTARFKVYLIDEAHMLTDQAANALLKTLEEPPAHVIFILATTDSHKLPATIISRCQRFDFRRITVQSVVDRLSYICGQEGIDAEPGALDLIARTATGSLRDGVNLLDQVVAHGGRSLTLAAAEAGLGLIADGRSFDLAKAVLAGDIATSLRTLSEVRDDGADMRQFQRETVAVLRQLMLLQVGAGDVGVAPEKRPEYDAVLAGVQADTIVKALKAIAGADLRADPHSSLPIEIAVAETLLLGSSNVPMASEPVVDTMARSTPRSTAASADVRPTAPPKPAPQPPTPTPAPQVEQPPRERPKAQEAVEKPEQPAATTIPAVSTGADIEALRQRWSELYRVTKSVSVKAGALLNSGCDIIGVEDDVLVLGFRHTMPYEKMVSGDGGANLLAVQKALDKVFGPGWKVRCVHQPGMTEGGGKAATRSPLVEQALNSGAKLVNRK